jgi:hypothetical protein
MSRFFNKKTLHASRSTLHTARTARRGQVLLTTVLTLGGTILGATTIAGLLLVYQIRQATDLANSGKAIYAADTGVEWGLYQFFRGGLAQQGLSNGASITSVTCLNAGGSTVDCTDPTTAVIESIGGSGNVKRAFELRLINR